MKSRVQDAARCPICGQTLCYWKGDPHCWDCACCGDCLNNDDCIEHNCRNKDSQQPGSLHQSTWGSKEEAPAKLA